MTWIDRKGSVYELTCSPETVLFTLLKGKLVTSIFDFLEKKPQPFTGALTWLDDKAWFNHYRKKTAQTPYFCTYK